MKIKLVQIAPSGEEAVLLDADISEQRIMVGRKPKDESKVQKEDNTYNIFIDNATVSSKHCELVFDGADTLTINDSSRNGTTLLCDGEERIVKNEAFLCDNASARGAELVVKTKDMQYRITLGDKSSEKKTAERPGKKQAAQQETDGAKDNLEAPSQILVDAPKEKKPRKPKEKKPADAEAGEQAEKKQRKQKEKKESAEGDVEPKEKKPRKKKNLDVPKEAKKRTKKETGDDEASESVHKDDFKEFDLSDNENSDSSVVQDMVVDDEKTSDSSDSKVNEADLVDKPAEEIDFSPEQFLVNNAEQASLQLLEDGKKMEDADFKKQYPTVIIPKPQLDEDLDLYLQIRHFDLFEAPVWTSDLTSKQEEVLERFNCKVCHDLNPEKIKYYICAKPKRTARFLLALAAGVPIVDASTLELPSVIAKSKKLEYRYLECKMMNPSVQDVTGPYNDDALKELIAKYYTNYNLSFVTSQLQQHRLLCPFDYLVISDFTLKYDVAEAEHLETLINYGLFLCQLGARVVLALDSDTDSLLRGSEDVRKLVQSKQFKHGIVRALEGDTALERATEYVKKLREQNGSAQVGQVIAETRQGFDIVGCDPVDKEDFARSCLLGFWVEGE